MSTPGPAQPAPPEANLISEVRYRLPDLLAEIQAERKGGLFAQERFSQSEIQKIFKAHKSRHGKRRS